MRVALLSICVLFLFACPTGSGPQGPAGEQGPQGPQGATGPTGPQGARGDIGPMGAMGAMGTQGVQGDVGPQGPQGIQGPQGAVLVIDGGVVTGPPGASVVVTAITAGGATCPFGGVRVTQLSDGGITNVCNGQPGAQGDAGAQGPAGPQGPQGIAGNSVTASTLPTMSPQCATGGVLLTQADGGTLAICNGGQGPQGAQGPQGIQGMTGATGAQGPQGMQGATGAQGMTGATGSQGPQGMQGATGSQGPQGMTGATGSAGATGPMGPAGPAGPPGAVLYLDGGYVFSGNPTPITFAGYTAATYGGNLGGQVGANAKCAAEFSGSYFCTIGEYDQANTPGAPGGVGAWIDYDRKVSGARDTNSCLTGNGTWTTNLSGSYGGNITAVGSFYSSTVCSNVKPLACCRGGARRVAFRGYTATTYTGDLGGQVGANAKCSAEFAGSSFCTIGEYDLANTGTPPGGVGAWIDYDRKVSGARDTNSCLTGNGTWTTGNSGSYGGNITAVGSFYSSTVCSNVKPLACCQNL
ncbi:MAG: hypothetical protein QM817_37825 [Archangium sp.]